MERSYFIAIIPPPDIAKEVGSFKQLFASQYESSAALRSPAHITLIPPFKIGESQHETLLSWFHRLRPPVKPFYQELNGFMKFDNKRPVIFINPTLNPVIIALHNWLHKKYAMIFLRRLRSGNRVNIIHT